nr:MAG TPA: hypothetical protein [Caudoviricetes sp.]
MLKGKWVEIFDKLYVRLANKASGLKFLLGHMKRTKDL